MKVLYNWLQEYIDAPLPPVRETVDALTMHSFEVEGTEKTETDTILDIKILPNRSHDCLSHYGIASEICSALRLPRKNISESVTLPKAAKEFKVSIKEKDLCTRMYAIRINGVNVAESPEWLRARLQSMGQKPINNIVDVTNYMMYALGQPMHVFDADTIVGDTIYIRKAKAGEKITLLNDKEYTLTPETLVIADKDKPLDVAGIMGGKGTATYEKTKNVLLVVDNFNPVLIRKTAKMLGIRTDASVRFENEISSSLVDRALPHTLKLISELAGGTVAGAVDVYPKPQKQTTITVTADKISRLLGSTYEASGIVEVLSRQNIQAIEKNSEIVVTIPFARLDLTLPEDIAEEIGRVHGYEHIAPRHLEGATKSSVNPVQYITHMIRRALCEVGFSEIQTYAFVGAGDVEVENPLASDKKFLRKDLATAMERSLDSNFKFLDLLGISEIKLFEIGKVFHTKAELLHLSIGVKYPKGKKGNVDEEIARAIHAIEKTLGISIGNISIVGGIAEINLEKILKEVAVPETYPENFWENESHEVHYKPISPYPFAVRDVAVFVPSAISADEVKKIISEHLTPIVVRFSLFDTFVKGDKTSYAFRLIFQSSEKTLTDEEINTVMNPIYESLKSQDGFEVR
ncbi:MAG: phenylalanine--tRNA ligase subunit beta [Patescibacteria group bacterium]